MRASTRPSGDVNAGEVHRYVRNDVNPSSYVCVELTGECAFNVARVVAPTSVVLSLSLSLVIAIY